MRVHLNVKESHNWQVALEHGQNWKKEIKLQQKKTGRSNSDRTWKLN
jgi:hypothetical protein